MPPTYKSSGDVWNIVASGAKTQGDVESFTDFVGVWLDDVPDGALGALSVAGDHELPKTGGDTFAPGDKLYWTGSELTTTPTANVYAGRASIAAGSGATSAQVTLNAGNA